MEWYNNPEKNQIEAEVVIPDHFNGYPGVAHGGIVAAILDETAGRAVMLDGDFENLFVTLKLEVTYRKITPTNTPLIVTGWINQGSSKRKKVAAEIRLVDGTVTAECLALVTPHQSKSLKPGNRKSNIGRCIKNKILFIALNNHLKLKKN